MSTFSGHKNWNYWNVSLWINNDEGLYALARECIRVTSTMEAAATLMRDQLHAYNVKATPDGAPYSARSIRAALGGMDRE